MFLFLQFLRFFSSLSLHLVLAPTRTNPASSSLHVSPLLVLSLSLAIFRSVSPLYLTFLRCIYIYIYLYISLLSLPPSFFPYLLLVSPVPFPCTSLHSLALSFIHSRSLPTSRWSALDPTRYRPHSRAQTTRQRYMYMHSRVHRSSPLSCRAAAALQPRSAARSIMLLCGPEKS